MITLSIMGLIGSDTSACNGWDSTGRRNPASEAMCPELPAVTTPTRLAPIKPLLVSTPMHTPFSLRKPITSRQQGSAGCIHVIRANDVAHFLHALVDSAVGAFSGQRTA